MKDSIIKKDPITLAVQAELKAICKCPIHKQNRYYYSRRTIDQIYQNDELCTIENMLSRLRYLDNYSRLNIDLIVSLVIAYLSGIFTPSLFEKLYVNETGSLVLNILLTIFFVLCVIALMIYSIRRYGTLIPALVTQMEALFDSSYCKDYERKMLKEKLELKIENCANKQAHPHDADGLDKCTNQTTLLSEPEKPCR